MPEGFLFSCFGEKAAQGDARVCNCNRVIQSVLVYGRCGSLDFDLSISSISIVFDLLKDTEMIHWTISERYNELYCERMLSFGYDISIVS